jgi:signal transduction histidine kinase
VPSIPAQLSSKQTSPWPWLSVSDALPLASGSPGAGIATAPPAGVGLRSMRERAAELGGACVVTARPEGGTGVRAFLPTQPAASGGSR